LDSQSQQAIV